MSKKNKTSVTYPFATKAQISDRLATDDGFVLTCLAVIAGRTASRTPGAKSHGFMSSHEKRGLALAAAVQESATPEQVGEARVLCLKYTKQLAAHLRAAEIAANPELAEVAKKFMAG